MRIFNAFDLLWIIYIKFNMMFDIYCPKISFDYSRLVPLNQYYICVIYYSNINSDYLMLIPLNQYYTRYV